MLLQTKDIADLLQIGYVTAKTLMDRFNLQRVNVDKKRYYQVDYPTLCEMKIFIERKFNGNKRRNKGLHREDN